MKKIISCLIVFSMVFCLISCDTEKHREENNNENKYKVVEVGGFDNAPSSDLAHNFEFFFETNYTVDESKQSKTKKFKINGEKLIFEYEQTKKGYLYNDEVDIYVCTDNDDIEVEYDAKKKKIRAIDFADINEAEKKSYEECVEIARNELKKYTDDVDSYTLRDYEYPSDSDSYYLEFVRIFGGVKTKDRAIFVIDWCGNISSFVLRSWESMKNAEYPGEDEMKVIESKISEKVDGIFAPVKDKYIITCMDESTEIDFMRLADGSYVLVYYLNFLLTSVSDPEFKDSESCVLMVYC